jgi:predicted dehydrogenase
VDVDQRQLARCAGELAKWRNDETKQYGDYREMLEKEKPEIAIVATPDHWHPLATIAAVKAGAHVYVEKPIGHTIMEGRAMVNAARAANRVVQVGTHRRVSPHNVSGRKFLQEGKAGKIGMVRCFVLSGGDGPEQPKKNTEPPKELNWDMWCGPAPLRPYNGGPDGRGGMHPPASAATSTMPTARWATGHSLAHQVRQYGYQMPRTVFHRRPAHQR